MKPLVIYHDNCADGFGAAFAAWLKLGDDAEYLPMQYGKSLPEYQALLTIADREIYILDFSFPKQVMDELFQYAKRVVWLDHHKTAFEMMGVPVGLVVDDSPSRYMVLDNNKSGAYLAWEYFHPETEVPMLIQHIDDYDRWVFALPNTKPFNKALWSYAPWSFQQWSEMFINSPYPVDRNQLYAEGAAILRAHDQNVQSVVKSAARECEIHICEFDNECEKDIDRYITGLVANCPPHLTSDVGHELATTSGTFGLCWTLSQTGLIAKCSLRSNGDYDVSDIARAFGGGGHKNAAGFSTNIETLLGWLK